MIGPDNVSRRREDVIPLEGHSHVVGFYDKDIHLVDFVRNFLAPSLLSGNAAIVVATESHRDLFTCSFAAAGIDVRESLRRGRLIVLDASETLSKFMVDGMPDPVRFRAVIGELVSRAAEGPCDVRIYGEMVAVLWDQGNVAAAIALEDLWNGLATTHSFSLYCAYSILSVVSDARLEEFRKIYGHHSRLALVRSCWPGPAAHGKR